MIIVETKFSSLVSCQIVQSSLFPLYHLFLWCDYFGVSCWPLVTSLLILMLLFVWYWLSL